MIDQANHALSRPLPAKLVPGGAAARLLLGVAAGVCVMTLSAKVSVPFWPVPLTLQGLAVLVLGAVQGRRAPATMLAYIGLGALGLPVFAGAAAGPAYLAGPTGGYLAGFVAAAALLGRMDLARPGRIVRTASGMLAAGAIVLLCGATWLAILFGAGRAIELGVLPFIVPELVKVGLATAMIVVLGSHRGITNRP